MFKKQVTFIALLLTLQTIQAHDEYAHHAISALLDTCRQSQEDGGSKDFYSYQLGGPSYRLTPDQSDPFWKKALISLGIMVNYNGSTYYRNCYFKDNTLEEKQSDNSVTSKYFTGKARDLDQAYNWSRNSPVTLYFSTKTNEFVGFHVYSTNIKNNSFLSELHSLNDKNLDEKTRNNELTKLAEKHQYETKRYEVDNEKFGNPTEVSQHLHQAALIQLQRELKDTPIGESRTIEFEGYGTFKCCKQPNAWGNVYYTCHK